MNKKITKKAPLETLTKSKINTLLKQRPMENLKTLREMEDFFKKKRGYVIKPPKKGEKIIVPFSGGMDSVSIAFILMKYYQAELYPFFTLRNQSYQRAEELTCKYFYQFFNKRFPGQFHNIKRLSINFPPMETRDQYERVENTPFEKGSMQRWGDFFYIPLLHITAAQFSYYLQIRDNIKIRTIISGVMKVDGVYKQDHQLTTIRSVMHHICTATNDYSWQVYAYPIEKELNMFYDKEYFIKWGIENGVPLNKTRSSCKGPHVFHCGVCKICDLRQKAFKKAKVSDPTIYIDQNPINNHIRNSIETLKLLALPDFE